MAIETEIVKIQLRRGTSLQWYTNNPILSAGEFGYETDTGNCKAGDGTTPYRGLPYINNDLCSMKSYTNTITYKLDDLVTSVEEGKVKMYRSMVNNNLGNPLDDTTKWDPDTLGGKELDHKITELQNQVASLQSQLASLQALVVDMQANITTLFNRTRFPRGDFKDLISQIPLNPGTSYTYTAEADGWFFAARRTSGNQYVGCYHDTLFTHVESWANGGMAWILVPMSQGQTLSDIRGSASGADTIVRFIYAK